MRHYAITPVVELMRETSTAHNITEECDDDDADLLRRTQYIRSWRSVHRQQADRRLVRMKWNERLNVQEAELSKREL